MQLGGNLGHLTYCTNIHAGNSWPEIFAALEKNLPKIKAEISPNAPFGIGLRLSALAAEALCDRQKLADFQEFLGEGNYYVFTVNGFPYGNFHGDPVKQGAYRPDWTNPARLQYTNILADLLAKLLPHGMEGSISTVPGTYKPWAQGDDAQSVTASIVDNIVKHLSHLIKIYNETGKTIGLCLEPEPFCLIETIEETTRFFDDHLFGDRAVTLLASLTGLSKNESRDALRRHLGVCYDVCHAAVEFEDPGASLAALKDSGIGIFKVQLSSAMRVPVVGAQSLDQLQTMDEPVYMHQVVENRNGVLKRYADIPEALQVIDEAYGAEWRIHFHVPVFLEQMQAVATTQQFLINILAIHARTPVTKHLEVETYTWDILPDDYRQAEISADIARELDWVINQLNQ